MRHGLRLISINIHFSVVHIPQFVPSSFSQHILIFVCTSDAQMAVVSAGPAGSPRVGWDM